MASFKAFPPVHHHSSKRISASSAQKLLSAFLEESITDPSLHPNALLTETGPVTPSSGANTGLVLHNLRRVEAGLWGEHLAADLTFEAFSGQGFPGLNRVSSFNGDQGRRENGVEAGTEPEEGWQDKAEYEREQAIIEGEVGSRNNAAEGLELKGNDGRMGKPEGRIPAVKSRPAGTEAEKAARRKRKKEKRDQQRREREAQRQKEAEAESRG